MTLVRLGLDVLSDRECRDLLSQHTFGRVALCVDALPVILPVHYAMHNGSPVFRTDHGAKLMAASAGHVLCLEIDDADPVNHTGWSVIVTGSASVLTSPEDLEEARRLPLQPWVGNGDVFVQIDSHLLSGRRIAPPH